MITRRTFTKGVALTAAAVWLRGGPSWGHGGKRPRAIIQIFLPGGLDSIRTSDPKTAKEVAARVHRGYEDRDILHAAGRRVGPSLAPLLRWLPQMTIVNGVDTATVSHAFGSNQTVEMQRGTPRPSRRGLLGTIASLDRPEPVLSQFWSIPIFRGTKNRPDRCLISNPMSVGEGVTVVSQLYELSQHRRRWSAVDAALATERGRCSGDCDSLETSHRLLEALSKIPRFRDLPPIELNLDAGEKAALDRLGPIFSSFYPTMIGCWQAGIRDTLFLLQHDLTRSIFISAPETWDTHQVNDDLQHANCAHALRCVSVLLQQLKDTIGPRGVPLADEVMVVMSSELGRHPYLNSLKGKDHFPEMPVFLLGPGLAPGSYGATDHVLLSKPVSRTTGRPVARAEDGLVPTIDDIGASILKLFGIDPLSAGYVGHPLDFLFG